MRNDTVCKPSLQRVLSIWAMPEMTHEEWFASLTKKDIMKWVVEHCDDQDAMDSLQKVVFPFSSRFSKKSGYAAQV